ncbi:luciferin 4-monooxygenase-like [Cydia amplana]|uniref:luciferin 4-monooxygenase-like n=1 Tax=Cydia amplana TaxID=1869771 RepID=UPI002FE53346
MYPMKRENDSVHWFMNELTSRVVAESGIPTDIHHLGKILLRSLKDDPGFVLQIDGATGEQETTGSVLERSVRCAIALKNLGLQRGDAIILMAPNHLDLAIPFYAAFYLGVMVAPIDRTALGVYELQGTFEAIRPKAIFCQSDRALDVQLALKKVDAKPFIVTFDTGSSLCSFKQFLDTYGDQSPVNEFKPTDLDPEDTIALLISTSGTTGLPKSAAATQKNLVISSPYLWSRYTQFPKPTKMTLIVSPLQWLTAILMFLMSPILRFTRLQTSLTVSPQHACHLINTYKPTYKIISPPFLNALLRSEGGLQCDFSCFEAILVGGSAVTADLIQEVKKIAPNTEVLNAFGMSEVTSLLFVNEGLNPGSDTVGKPMGLLQYRLIDTETQEDIYEPNKNGELWVKGPSIVKGYYRNPEATAEAFTEDRWFKTGDIFYRDENYNFFFVDRIKLMFYYMTYRISPVAIEALIRQHPGVQEVAVTGIPDPTRGELPAACVVRRPGGRVTADEIKQLVKENLADAKQLRGGVIFLDTIPLTPTAKIHRKKLKEIAMRCHANAS